MFSNIILKKLILPNMFKRNWVLSCYCDYILSSHRNICKIYIYNIIYTLSVLISVVSINQEFVISGPM